MFVCFNPSIKSPALIGKPMNPARQFIESAVKMLGTVAPGQEQIILRDIADYVECDPNALNFLIAPCEMVEDISIPSYI